MADDSSKSAMHSAERFLWLAMTLGCAIVRLVATKGSLNDRLRPYRRGLQGLHIVNAGAVQNHERFVMERFPLLLTH
jgi:hypothetical protein